MSYVNQNKIICFGLNNPGIKTDVSHFMQVLTTGSYDIGTVHHFSDISFVHWDGYVVQKSDYTRGENVHRLRFDCKDAIGILYFVDMSTTEAFAEIDLWELKHFVSKWEQVPKILVLTNCHPIGTTLENEQIWRLIHAHGFELAIQAVPEDIASVQRVMCKLRTLIDTPDPSHLRLRAPLATRYIKLQEPDPQLEMRKCEGCLKPFRGPGVPYTGHYCSAECIALWTKQTNIRH